MVIQYPNIGKAYLPAASSQDGNGDWVRGAETLQFETSCRVEPASSNQFITQADGRQITFTSIVYMPAPAADIKPGAFFEVWRGSVLIVREPVKQFSRGQLNARVWL